MINAGTARRNAGSAIRSRRYAGFAIDWASPLIESEFTDALATSARAMPRLRSGPHHLHRKDVPHLSESLLIGIERWRFVEGSVNESARLMNRCFVLDGKRLSARDPRHLRSRFVPRGARASVFGQRALRDVAHVG